MKKRNILLNSALFALAVFSLVSCNKESIKVSTHELWFPIEASVQDITITANCPWSIKIDDDADWYTIRESYDTTVFTSNGSMTYSAIETTKIVTSGRGDMTLSILVDPLEGVPNRASSFTITSANGHIQVQVRVLQNTNDPTELQSITNMIFGVSNAAHWNTDYYGEVVEDSYQYFEFNPNDTTTGYLFYFLDDGMGIQKDSHADSTVYYLYTYEFDPFNRILHIEFETVSDTISEIYNAPVLCATEEVFRIMHEYRPNFWERFDMKKIGNFTPQQKAILKRKAKKRDGHEPILIF